MEEKQSCFICIHSPYNFEHWSPTVCKTGLEMAKIGTQCPSFQHK